MNSINSIQDRAGVAGDSIKPGARAPGNRRKIPLEPAERATVLGKRWSLSANTLWPLAPRAWFYGAVARSAGSVRWRCNYLGFRWRFTPGFMLTPAPQALAHASLLGFMNHPG